MRYATILTCVCLANCGIHAKASADKPAITALAIAPQDKGHVQASQAGVIYHDFATKQHRPLATKLDHIHTLSFSPDGKLLAVAGGFPAERGVVELWSWPDLKHVGNLDEHKDVVYAVAWLQNSQRLATASADRTVRLWDVAKRKPTATLSGHSAPVLALAATSDGRWLCSGGSDHTIRVWKTADAKMIRTLSNHLAPVRDLAFRPAQGQRPPYLASASDDKTIRIWQPTIGRMVRIIRHPAPVTTVTWSRDGVHLYSGAKDGALRVIDGDSDGILNHYGVSKDRVLSIAVSQKGNLLFLGTGNGKVRKQVMTSKN